MELNGNSLSTNHKIQMEEVKFSMESVSYNNAIKLTDQQKTLFKSYKSIIYKSWALLTHHLFQQVLKKLLIQLEIK